ncbi:MAG: DUF5667 domain-containing protein [bacterium]
MKKVTPIAFLAFLLFVPCLSKSAFAAGASQDPLLPTSPLYVFVKIKESVQQLFTFDQDSKTALLEEFSQQRIDEMSYAASENDTTALNLSLERYQSQKTKALGYVKGASDTRIAQQVRETALEQQRVMTRLQLQVGGTGNIQQNIVRVQKEVAVETKNTIGAVLGAETAQETENNTRYVWLDPNADTNGNLPPLPDEIAKWEYAPGTQGRDEVGRVVEYTMAPGTGGQGTGGQTVQVQWAPGTEGGGESGVVYEGGPKVVVVGGGDSGSGGNTVSGGGGGNQVEGGGNQIQGGGKEEVVISP